MLRVIILEYTLATLCMVFSRKLISKSEYVLYSFIPLFLVAKLREQIGQIMMDNAANCETAMETIANLCLSDGVPFDKIGNQIWCIDSYNPFLIEGDLAQIARCFPHIINIAVQTIIKEIKEYPAELVKTSKFCSVDVPLTVQSHTMRLASDPIGKAHAIVTALHSSGQRCEELTKIIKTGNIMKHWNIQPQQLLWDVETCWSSLYGMIGRILDLYEVSTLHFCFMTTCNSNFL